VYLQPFLRNPQRKVPNSYISAAIKSSYATSY